MGNRIRSKSSGGNLVVTVLSIACALVLGGCASVDSHRSAAASANPPADPDPAGDYPSWSRITSLLLMPFTQGISAGGQF